MQARIIGAALAILTVAATAAAQGIGTVGAVYTATNHASGNSILAFDRDADGSLQTAGSVSTGGLGTGAGLGNQGGLRMTQDGKFLIVVNAGSHDISVVEVGRDGLVLRDRKPSGGLRPVSVAVDARLIYVLNAGGAVGGADNVTGFRLSRDGRLSALPNSTRPLSATSTGPAQVEFSPDGAHLVVTEKATNRIDVFAVGDDGRLGPGMSYASAGQTPFGFAFGRRNQFFVSEAFGGAPNGSAVSSYEIRDDGLLQVISPSVPTTETAACWVVVSEDGRFAYATNAGSGSISGYGIRPDGTIALLDADGATATPGAGPSDVATTGNGRFIYALHAGLGAISVSKLDDHGGLTSLGLATLPAGANGLVAR